jgi:Na+/H+ antiporter NhaD/arsenite permease-like protein
MATTALVIFLITYTGIIFTRLPKVNIDRPSAAFFGAVAMVIFGVLTFDEAIESVDFNTITLLLGMMVIITTLKLDGFFALIAQKTIAYSGTQFRLLVIIVFVTGFSSAFLVNDAVVLLFTPIIISICRSSKLNPVPYLIGEILASNAGSVMTITGNPQNMLIGINSGISYLEFLMFMLPIAILSLLVITITIRFIYPANFKNSVRIDFTEQNFDYNFRSMRYSVPVFILVIIAFFLSKWINISIPLIALAGASLVLILGKIKPSTVIKEVDWVLLLFFASLFIVVHGVEKSGLISSFLNNNFLSADAKGIGFIHVISLVLSQIASNVPYTVAMLPLMKSSGSEILWLALASASTLAGNATIIGAMANLIVIDSAEKNNVKIKFFEFLKSGVIVTLITMTISFLILYLYLYLALIN